MHEHACGDVCRDLCRRVDRHVFTTDVVCRLCDGRAALGAAMRVAVSHVARMLHECCTNVAQMLPWIG